MVEDEALELKLVVNFRVHPPARKSAKAQAWFKDKKHLEAAVDALAELPLFKEAKLAGPDEKLKAFKDAASARSLVATGRAEWTRIQSSDDTRPDLEFLFQPEEDELDFTIRCSRAILEKHSDTIIDQYVTATEKIRAALGDGLKIAARLKRNHRSRCTRQSDALGTRLSLCSRMVQSSPMPGTKRRWC